MASNLLYVSLLVSLLAAFVAMLGKQWLSRYLRHRGGSMIRRCGDRQRKFDGLERWGFRFFIESLPIMLQIALLFLTCGLSQYMWSVNTSIALVLIASTAIGFLLYIVIVVAGTSSYECPFQTPVSIILRYLKERETVRKWRSVLSTYTVRSNTPGLLASMSLPNTASLIHASWIDAWRGIKLAFRRAQDIIRQPLSWEFSVSSALSGIRRTATKIGHQVIILLLQMDRALGNAKHRLAQGMRRSRRAELLPTFTGDVHHQPSVPHNPPQPLVRPWDLEAIRRQNADNASCICWVLQNITDPEAIDSAIRLAGTIRWFDGDYNHNPPFDLIVIIFKACFDSTGRLHPGMMDRAYFSGRAILQIHMRARIQSQGHASNYPLPFNFSTLFLHANPDFFHLIRMLECNLDTSKPTLPFPDVSKNTQTHLLWFSNLFADLTRASPNPILVNRWNYLAVARSNHRPMIASILLMWCKFLGRKVEEEIIWASNESYATISSFLSACLLFFVSVIHWRKSSPTYLRG